MSKRMLNISVAAVLAAGAVAASDTASAMPLGNAQAIRSAAATAADSNVTPVWYDGGWGWGPAFIGGAILGSALAAPYYGPPYPYYGGPYPPPYGYYPGPVYRGNDAAGYCASRYRSWDPATGTFLGYDGLRHHCP